MGFDHNNEKNVRFLTFRHIYSLENHFTGGRCHLAWRVLILADENYRGEPHEITKFLTNVLKTLSTFDLKAEKKKKNQANSERYFKIFYSWVNL